MIVDFFICGVQKGGTTALDSFLRKHPDIQMARVKEAHFFDNENVDWTDPDYDKLHALYREASSIRLRGESTPIYAYWPQAMQRLHRYNPAAKLILVLRHPVMRAWSHWRMETTRGWETLPFGEAIRPAARERVRTAPGGVHRVHSYVERGFYASQVERLLELFPEKQILILRNDRLWSDPGGTLRTVFAFLGVPPAGDMQRRYVVPFVSDAGARLDRGDADYLAGLYADDIQETERLTGLDLRDWLVTPVSENAPGSP